MGSAFISRTKKILGLVRILTQKINQAQVEERITLPPIAGEQVAEICQRRRALRHRQAKQIAERRRTERIAGDQQQTEDRPQLRAPARPRTAQTVELERKEMPRSVEQQGDQFVRRQNIGAGQFAGDQIEVERVPLHRRIEAINQRRVKVSHLPMAQDEIEVSTTEGRQPVGACRCA